LLKIIVGKLSRRLIDTDFLKCRETLVEIFSNDQDGIVSFEAVGLLAKMMKAKDFRIHDSVLDTFLHLRLLSEFSSKASKDAIDKQCDDKTLSSKRPKAKREFRTKKQRKLLRERNAVVKDMKEADALVSHEQRDKMQAESLKLVFSTYFRILKLRRSNLMGAVLEGLAKYAHLINQDFFGDILEALKDLISQAESRDMDGMADSDDASDEFHDVVARNTTREALLCTNTAFALLEGQDASKAASSLHLDLSFFVAHLYQTLYALSVYTDIEFIPGKSLRLPDPGSGAKDTTKKSNPNKVNFQTPTVLLVRCLQSTLVAKASNAPPPIRLAGFAKRLMTALLQLPEKSALAILSLLTLVAKQHGRKIAPLWHTEERKGDGVFNPIAADVEESNVFAGTVWEGELLRMHYCPQVREAAADIEKIIASLK
jgi:nucleolar complex protein 3